MLVQRQSGLSVSEQRQGEILIGVMHFIQGGFRKGHSCPMHVATLHHNIIVRKGLKVIFLDVRKAYDTVPIEIAMRRLAKRLPGLGQPLLPVITSLFTNTSFRVFVRPGVP